MAGISPSSGPSPSAHDMANMAIQLTNRLKTINANFGREFLVVEDQTLSTISDFNKSSPVEELSPEIFDTLREALPTSAANDLYQQVVIYRHYLADREAQTPRERSTEKVKSVTSKMATPTEKTAPADASEVLFSSSSAENRPSEKSPESEEIQRPTKGVRRVHAPSLKELRKEPNISIEDLTNAFQPLILKVLQDSYLGKSRKDSERMGYYLAGAFHQKLSVVTELIDQGEIETEQEAIDLLLEDFEEMYARYQRDLNTPEENEEEVEQSRLPPPLTFETTQRLRGLMLSPDAIDTFRVYFRQIIREKEIEET